MTLSIVARCPETGQMGIAAATGIPGVGKLLTWAQPHIGAIATQGWVNPYLGIDGLDLLANGHPADRVLDAVLALDPSAEQRQVGIVDARARARSWTGSRCADWAGHATAEGVAVQGNLLVSGEGVEATLASYLDSGTGGVALVERLMNALEAGIRAGGDRRGERSATVLVMDGEEYPLWDVRIDESDDPLPELRRMQHVLARDLVAHIRKLPRRENPVGELDPASEDGLV